MLSFLPGISIKFEKNAFKVEKSREILGSVCKSGLFGALRLLPSILNIKYLTPRGRRAGASAQCYAG